MVVHWAVTWGREARNQRSDRPVERAVFLEVYAVVWPMNMAKMR
jgi:hypothetical protein